MLSGFAIAVQYGQLYLRSTHQRSKHPLEQALCNVFAKGLDAE